MSAQVAPTPAANVPTAPAGNVAMMPQQAAPMMTGAPMPVPETQAASASLYVGDLAPEVSEANLFETFNAIGPVVSIRVCRDSITRRSLGYAYVNFQYQPDAARALEELNFQPINGRQCRIMWSQRDPLMRRSGANNIFIKNLDASIDNKQLYDTFLNFGPILSCKVATNSKGESRGYGFVHFEKTEAAQAAIDKVDGKMIMDKVVTVSKFKTRKEREASQGERKFTNIFVKNLPASLESDKALSNMFSGYGTVTSCYLSPPSDKTPSRRYGFVNFENPDDAAKAVEDMNEKEVEEDCKLFVGRAMKKEERARILKRQHDERVRELDAKNRGVNLYVKHLADDVTEADLKELFGKFGEIKSLRIMVDPETKASRGFGFVSFDDSESATKALTDLHQQVFHDKPLYVALALRKAERQNQLAQERSMRSRAMMPGMGGMPGYFPPYMGRNMMMPGMRFPMPMQGQQMQMNMNMMYKGNMPNMQGQPHMGGRPGGRGNGRGRGSGRGRGRGRGASQGAPAQQQDMAQQQPQQAAPASNGQPSLNAKTLLAMDETARKNTIGNHIYGIVSQQYPAQRAGKITGMLLEMGPDNLLVLLDQPKELEARAKEAFEVLLKHETAAAASQ